MWWQGRSTCSQPPGKCHSSELQYDGRGAGCRGGTQVLVPAQQPTASSHPPRPSHLRATPSSLTDLSLCGLGIDAAGCGECSHCRGLAGKQAPSAADVSYAAAADWQRRRASAAAPRSGRTAGVSVSRSVSRAFDRYGHLTCIESKLSLDVAH